MEKVKSIYPDLKQSEVISVTGKLWNSLSTEEKLV